MAHPKSASEPAGLARGAIGLREVLFQAVTSMAPAGALALSISLGATYAGGAPPLAVLLALVGCLLVASSNRATGLRLVRTYQRLTPRLRC
jgi:amino acid transporter